MTLGLQGQHANHCTTAAPGKYFVTYTGFHEITDVIFMHADVYKIFMNLPLEMSVRINDITYTLGNKTGLSGALFGNGAGALGIGKITGILAEIGKIP